MRPLIATDCDCRLSLIATDGFTGKSLIATDGFTGKSLTATDGFTGWSHTLWRAVGRLRSHSTRQTRPPPPRGSKVLEDAYRIVGWCPPRRVLSWSRLHAVNVKRRLAIGPLGQQRRSWPCSRGVPLQGRRVLRWRQRWPSGLRRCAARRPRYRARRPRYRALRPRYRASVAWYSTVWQHGCPRLHGPHL